MGRVSVIIYITVAILLLVLISHSPNKSSQGRHRRLKLRSNFSFVVGVAGDRRRHDHVPFDPLVVDIEMRREDKEWEKMYFESSYPELAHQPAGDDSQPEWEDFMNAEDYLNDEGKFNVTDRLVLLFPRLDVDPSDGYATEHELTEWILMNTEKEVLHRTQREIDLHDKNKDGFVSFAEYEPPSWVRNSDNTSFGYEMGWWKEEHFNASDANGDGLLNISEFNDFLHPADSNNSELFHWLCKEEIRERDSNKDGKASFDEFFQGLFDMLRNYDEEEHNSSEGGTGDDARESLALKLFEQLDTDSDGYLSAEELLPVILKLHPTERHYSKHQAAYIISQADSDKDGQLTLAEMIDNPYVFYSAIFNEGVDDHDHDHDHDDEDYHEYHDEFR